MVDIVINDISPRIQYTAAASQTVFAYPFPIFASTDLVVYKRAAGSIPVDAADQLTYVTNYIVTNNVAPLVGGTITLNVGATSGDIVTIIRNMPEERLTNYINGGLFLATDVNTDFDRTVMMAQQNNMFTRNVAPQYQTNAVINNAVDLKLPILGAGECWVKNSANTAIVATAFAGGGGGGGSNLTWFNVGVNTNMAVNSGYVDNGAGTTQFLLPAVAAVGDICRVVGNVGPGWTITQGAGQQIRFGILNSTAGVGGSVSSTQLSDAVELVCVIANTTFRVISSIGNLTVI